MSKITIESIIEDRNTDVTVKQEDKVYTKYRNVEPEYISETVKKLLEHMIEEEKNLRKYEVTFSCVDFYKNGPVTTVYAKNPQEAYLKVRDNVNKWLQNKGIKIYNIGFDYVYDTKTHEEYRVHAETLG